MYSNREMVERLLRVGLIRSERVKEAFMAVDRRHFVGKANLPVAYVDRPLPIGHGQTISAPHMVAIMVEELNPQPGENILEVGTGSGYHAALVSRLVLPGGRVITVERIPELARFAEKNLKRAGIENVKVLVGDGSLGYPPLAPYDRIYVTAASPGVPPPLLEQLKEGGVLLIPVETGYGYQVLKKIWKRKGGVEEEDRTECVFVPLIGKHGY